MILVLEGLGGTTDCVEASGADWIEANPRNVDESCDLIDSTDWDGMVLTGGGDVDPRMYGQRPRKEVYGVSELRDLTETYALEVARVRKLPVLGICRGAQIINCEAGGTLKQHISGHRGTSHVVLTRDGTTLREWAGKTPHVISLRHQRIEQVARGYVVSSRAHDGTIESIETKNGRVLGCQFHPEMDFDEEYARCIFRWLVCEAADRARLEHPETRPVVSYYQSPRAYTAKHGTSSSINTGSGALALDDLLRQGNGSQWLCPHCAMLFDDYMDREDHVRVVHSDEEWERRWGGGDTLSDDPRSLVAALERQGDDAVGNLLMLPRGSTEGASDDADTYEPTEEDLKLIAEREDEINVMITDPDVDYDHLEQAEEDLARMIQASKRGSRR